MPDEEIKVITRELLLAMNRIQESLSAVSLVLKEQGVMNRAQYEDAYRRVGEMNRPRREKLEKLGSTDPMTEFLKGFQGPLQ